ncbi:hypothetical protein [Mycolicibacterium brisbanense]
MGETERHGSTEDARAKSAAITLSTYTDLVDHYAEAVADATTSAFRG